MTRVEDIIPEKPDSKAGKCEIGIQSVDYNQLVSSDGEADDRRHLTDVGILANDPIGTGKSVKDSYTLAHAKLAIC